MKNSIILNSVERFDNKKLLKDLIAKEYFKIAEPPLCIADAGGDIIEFNKQFSKLLKIIDIKEPHLNLFNLVTKKYKVHLESLLSGNYEQKTKLNIRSLMGKKLSVVVFSKRYEEELSPLFVLYFHDLTKEKKNKTKQKKQEKLLIQQSKMAAMGEMMEVITHQWKQPLNALAVIAQTIGDDFDHHELNATTIESHIEAIDAQIRFMNNTMDDFRRFFIYQKNPTKFCITKAINEIVSLVNPQMKLCNAIISIENFGPQAEVSGFCNEFKQVILNILVNAQDAIVTRRQKEKSFSTSQGIVNIKIITFNKYCRIEIADNGGGINEKSIKKIFDSYFTSKNDKGTGIGLYLSKKIIEQRMSGSITASNTVQGAQFTISLPLTDVE